MPVDLPRHLRRLPLLWGLPILSACGQTTAEKQGPAAPVEVATIRATPSTATISDELPGRVVAFRTAEIRPQVSGIVQRRLFEQGSQVRAGQPLFQIDPAPFRADASSAAAGLQRAEAALLRSRTQAERLRPLVEADAISRQSYDDAVAGHVQAAADVAQTRADLQRKRLDLAFATIRSPIGGRIDQAVVSEGALSTVGDATALATVQQIDRVYVDVRQPASQLQALQQIAAGQAATGAEVAILDPDGRPYAVHGRLLFSGITVDPGTGEVIARILVENDGRTLLPGMFVRARLPRRTLSAAISVPQQAVGHDASGRPTLSIVDARGQVHTRPVEVGGEVEGRSIVTRGLRAGEVVIVEGADRIAPGLPVKTVAWRGVPIPAAAR